MDPANRTPPRPATFPLAPHPSASLECLLGRLHRIHALLLRRGFSDTAASRAVEEVLRIGQKALDNGEAVRKTDEQRAGWLWKVALRAARRAASKEVIFAALTYDPPDHHPPPSDDESPLYVALRKEVERLPKRQEQAFVFCALQGLSLRDAAREMGVRPSTVGYHFKCACARLRQVLSGLEIGGIPGEKPAKHRARAPLY